MKVRSAWASGKGLRADPDGKQVRCLTADAGHVWIHAYDKLPPLVRKRLEGSPGLYRVFGVGATKAGMLRVSAAADEFTRKLDQARAEAARSGKPPVGEA